MEIVFRKRKKRMPRIKKKWLIILIAVLLLAYLILHTINSSVFPTMSALAEAKVKALATEAMAGAIASSVSGENKYAEIVEKVENGEKVYLLNSDTALLNSLASECSMIAQEKLLALSDIGVKISLGTLSGIALLSGRGPNVNIKFTPASVVKSSFSSELHNAGINQTLYRVKIILTTDIYIVLPGQSRTVSVTAEAAIAESVIVGDVPQVYTNVNGAGDEYMNFIPTELP